MNNWINHFGMRLHASDYLIDTYLQTNKTLKPTDQHFIDYVNRVRDVYDKFINLDSRGLILLLDLSEETGKNKI